MTTTRFTFSQGTGFITLSEKDRCERIAKKHNAEFHAEDGKFWFSARTAGHPFDTDVIKNVDKEVGRVVVSRELN